MGENIVVQTSRPRLKEARLGLVMGLETTQKKLKTEVRGLKMMYDVLHLGFKTFQ